EPDLASARGGPAKRVDDVRQPSGGHVAEERERDVQVLRRDHAAAREAALPAGEPLDRLRREPQGAEEPNPITALHASGRGHTCLCQLCVRSRRTRCSAITVERERIAPRSPGTLNSWTSVPSGPTAA